MEHPVITELQNRPRVVALLIGLVTLIVILLNGYNLMQGITKVLPHLFYIPIVITAYFFPRRGILFACLISAVYYVMACVLTPDEAQEPISAVGRIIIFILIAAVVSFLTLKLQESEATFRGVAERSSDIILLTDTQGKALYVSPSVRKILGYDPREIIGTMPQDFIHPGDIGMLNETIRHRTQGISVEEIVLRMRKKDGEYAIIEFLGSPVARNGRIIGLQVIGRDITDREKIESALRESEKKYRLLADYTYDWEYWVTHDETIIYTTPSCERITGYTAREFKENTSLIKSILHPEDLHAFDHHMTGGIGEQKPGNVDFRIIHRNGNIRWINHVCQPIYNEDGAFVGRRASNRDITDRKQVEMALGITNRKLNLLSSITRHDIKNQLFSLKAFLELSKDAKDNPEELEGFLAKADHAAQAIEQQIAFTKEYEDLGVQAPVWQDISSCLKSAMHALPVGNVQITDEISGLEIFADPLFEKVFYNLIDNALRYGGPGMKTIRFSQKESGQDRIIIVGDDGAGISEEDKERLFERGFGRHTGLGLFLSREILGITGITIREVSAPGAGACFEIHVPKGAWRRTGTE